MLREEKIQTHAPTTLPLGLTTALCLQYKRLRKKGLHCAWCDVREFKYRSNSDDYQDLLFEWKLMPCNSSCHNRLKNCLNLQFQTSFFCLASQNFSWIFNLKCKEIFWNILFSIRLKNFLGPIVSWLDRNGFSLWAQIAAC